MKIEAKKRLLAWEANSYSKSSLKNMFKTQTYDKVKEYGDKQKGNVKGFSIYSDDMYEEFFVLDDNAHKIVAIMDVYRFGKYRTVNSVMVHNDYQGKGVGFALYEYLLKDFGKLASSTSLSRGSSLLWSKLIQKHKGVLVVPVSHFDSIEVKIHGWVTHGHTYPIIEHAGQLISLDKIKPKNRDEKSALKDCYYLAQW